MTLSIAYIRILSPPQAEIFPLPLFLSSEQLISPCTGVDKSPLFYKNGMKKHTRKTSRIDRKIPFHLGENMKRGKLWKDGEKKGEKHMLTGEERISVREYKGWVRNVALIKCTFGPGKPKEGWDFGREGIGGQVGNKGS